MSIFNFNFQVRAAIDNDLYGHPGSVMPTLGLTWANLVTTRLMISRTESSISGKTEGGSKLAQKVVEYAIRQLEVIFCPWMERKSCHFVVTSKGIEDVE